MEPLNTAEGTGDKKHPSDTLPSSLSDKRGKWAHKREFILAVIGEIIGLGNVCRFPYLCFKNGGGAFLIPYTAFLVTCGIPIFFLEVSLGQLTSQGGITCWRKICPLLEGLGYGSQVMVFYSGVYYIVILAWGFLFLFHCFHAELPWTSCNNTWNTVNCVVNQLNHSVNGSASMNVTSSVVEFWQRRILGLSRGIEEMGGIRWDLAGCLLLSWIICYFCIWKGVKSSGKVVYFTATFPYLMLVILLIRSVTLPGAARGIYFYLNPDLSRLADFQVWMDAGSQVLSSSAVCLGCLPSLGSYNEYKNNCYRDTFGLCLLNSLTSIVSGFAVFSVLGFMADKLGLDISEVAESGPGLAFIAYPQALAMMPLSQLWAILFFLMIIFLGLDSQFVCLEGLVTSIADMYPSIFFVANRRKILLLIICVLSFFVDFFMVTEGGLYLFQLFEYYGCGGIPLITFVFLEAVTIGWMYGADKYYTNISDMIGYRPSPYMKYCWKYATPCFAMAILLFILAKFRPLKYNYTYEYPWWAYSFGLLLAFSSILMVPLWALYVLIKTPGTLRQKMKAVMTPADGLLRRQPKECEGLTSDTNL